MGNAELLGLVNMEMDGIVFEIVRVVLADDALRERILSELDITDEAALEALRECAHAAGWARSD